MEIHFLGERRKTEMDKSSDIIYLFIYFTMELFRYSHEPSSSANYYRFNNNNNNNFRTFLLHIQS